MNIKNILFGVITSAFLLSGANAADLGKEAIQPSAKLTSGAGSCSGTLIYSDRDKVTGEVKSVLLTAKHCVDGGENLQMKMEFPVFQGHNTVGEKTFYGTVLGKSYKSDLALIELNDKQTFFEQVAKVAPADYKANIGDPVVIVGNPLGLHISVSQGTWSGNQKLFNLPSLLHINGNIIGGNSGGAAFKEDDGVYKVVGVT